MAWSMGSELLIDIWQANALIFAFIALLIIGIGVAAAKVCDHADRQVVADGHCGADMQAAHAVFPRKRLLEALGLGEQGFGPGAELSPQLAQLQALAHPVEQLYTELPLEFFQGTAGRRLGHGQVPGCTADIFMPGSSEKYFQLAQGVAHG